MTDLSWLNNIPVPSFAFKAQDQNVAHILHWNDAMVDHSDVTSEMATQGKLAALSQRILRAVQRHAKTAGLGSLGTFEFKSIDGGIVVASLSARETRECADEKVLFLSMAAHDLRSPLRHINGLLDEVRHGFHDMGDGKLELLNMMEDVSERARVFTDDVIAYTWASHAQRFETERMDLIEFASDVFQSVNPTNKHTLDCPGVVVDVDQLALQITLRNLFDNAIRHGGQSLMKIDLQVEEIADITSVRFTVLDNGKGLSSPADCFVTATDLRSSSSFGLMGVKRLIEERGGEISAVKPESGTGSAITFTLPGHLEVIQQAKTLAG